MLPIIQDAVVLEKGWMTDEEFLNAISLTNSLPGPLAINSATFIGYRVKGPLGALAAALGAMVPSVIIIIIIATFFTNIMDKEIIVNIFEGVRPAVVALILYSVVKLGKSIEIKKEYNWLIAALGLIAISIFDIHPVFVIIAGAIYGIYIKFHLVKMLDSRGDNNGRVN